MFTCCEMSVTYLFRVQVLLIIARHMLCEANGLVPNRYSVLDNILELIDSVAGAELPRVGVHREGHCERRDILFYFFFLEKE